MGEQGKSNMPPPLFQSLELKPISMIYLSIENLQNMSWDSINPKYTLTDASILSYHRNCSLSHMKRFRKEIKQLISCNKMLNIMWLLMGYTPNKQFYGQILITD